MLVYLAFNNSACTSHSILHSPIDENRFYCILHTAISIDYNMSLITSQFQLREQMRSFKLSTIKQLTVNDNKHSALYGSLSTEMLMNKEITVL